MDPFSATLRAILQLDDPALLGTVLRGLVLAAVLFALIAAGAAVGIQAVLAGSWGAAAGGWIPDGWSWAAGLLGGAGVVILSAWLFLPVACIIAAAFSDRVALAVEHRHYPFLPPAAPASLASLTWDGLALGLRVLGLQVAILPVALVVPGLGPLLGWLLAAWAFGRGMFVTVAMRRMSRAAATAAYRRRRGAVLIVGALMVAANWLPLANLLAPVLAVAAMVHVMQPIPAPPGVAARVAGNRGRGASLSSHNEG
jgi:uncharacterized protein involved in cysteine biosynthesis